MVSVLYDNDVYLDPIVTSVTWSGEINRAFRKLEVTIKNTIDGRSQAFNIELGKELRLYSDDNELFRGIIFAHDIDAKANMTITAYDENVYLVKNQDTSIFRNMTASSIIREICANFGIPTGEIADTGYVIPKLLLRDKSLFEMMTIALTETRKQTGRRFLISAKAGALYLTERGDKAVDWVLDDATNILDASYAQSIEDLRNQVRVVGGDLEKNPLEAIVKDDALIGRFGLLQHHEVANADAKQAEIEQKARQLLEQLSKINDQASISAIGNVEVTAGTAVYVKESLTAILGGFYVVSDIHTWSNGVHRMDLIISGDEDLPRMDYDERG